MPDETPAHRLAHLEDRPARGERPVVYGAIKATWSDTVVHEAPEYVLMTVNMLLNYDIDVYTDRVHAGRTTDGDPVEYVITGWHPQERALILQRTLPAPTPVDTNEEGQ